MRSTVMKPGTDDYNISFEEYKLLLGWTNSLADRRQESNNLYFGMSGAVLTVIGIALSQLDEYERSIILLIAALVGIIICAVWNSNIQKYQRILKFKYTQLKLFEEVLGLTTSGLVTAEDNFFSQAIPLEVTGLNTRLEPWMKTRGFGIASSEQNLARLMLFIFFSIFIVAGVLLVI
jgi:hypothetical protein